MKLLLDTNALLWLLGDDSQLSPFARQHIEKAEVIAVSEVSLWEISIKISIGKLVVTADIYETIGRLGLRRLPLRDDYLKLYQSLPLLHRDPFDRMLVAQAKTESMSLLTSDIFLKDYGIHVIKAG